MTNYFDFNDAADPAHPTLQFDTDTIRAGLMDRLDAMIHSLFPNALVRGGKALLGNIDGARGDSLTICLSGQKRGQWFDFATQEGGDHVELFARGQGFSARTDFRRVMALAAQWLGTEPVRDHPHEGSSVPITHKQKSVKNHAPDLGPPTAKWDYLAADGSLIACVYRFEPEPGKKQFRPWNVATGKFEGLDPRPLYNLPSVSRATSVILVEGEKCAQALIDAGLCATTAMHGAKAPVDKTDWSPLFGKTVLIWPDKDKPGWEYAMAASEAIAAAGATSVSVLSVPEDKPESWDCADAVLEGFDIDGLIHSGARIPTNSVTDIDPLNGIDWRTEDGLAQGFANGYGQDWRYCAVWGKWYGWAHGRWNEDRALSLLYLIRRLARQATVFADTPRLKSKLASASMVGAIERLARMDPMHSALPEQFDVDPWLLNCPNGMVNLKTGVSLPHDRRQLMTRMATAAPNLGDVCPCWHSFLNDVTGGDAALQSYLQRMVGYCLTGSTEAHALFFLYGTGANGKSVFLNVIAAILGDYASNAPMETFMDSGNERHPTELASLRGARFVTAIETEQGRRWNESRIKTLTGGDKISARFMRQDFFEYTPQFKLVIAGNHKPAIRNVDEAMRRRLHLIPFTVTIPPEKRDSKLTEKLLAERAGILAWAIAGCLQWQEHGLEAPPVVRDATQEYFNNEDAVQEFEDEALIRDAQSQALVAKVYAAWKDFAERNGYYAGSVRWLTEQLVARGFMRVRGTGGAKFLRGVRLRVGEETWKPYVE